MDSPMVGGILKMPPLPSPLPQGSLFLVNRTLTQVLLQRAFTDIITVPSCLTSKEGDYPGEPVLATQVL